MIRFIIIRLLVLALVVYLIHLYTMRRKKEIINKKILDIEKADYNEKEWEKIKKELEK